MLTEPTLVPGKILRHHRRFFSSIRSEETPQVIVEHAIHSLQEFATKLQYMAGRVDQRHSVTTPLRTIQVSVAEAALHSRDSTMEDFSTALAGTMRELLVKEAKNLEASLVDLAHEYTQTIQPQMQQATAICQETPCGGATWELNLSTLYERAKEQGAMRSDSTSANQKVSIDGIHETPCGRLQLQSMSFLETTLHTKQQMLMAARCRTLLELSIEFEAPLRHIRTHGTSEQNQRIRLQFQNCDTLTPWIRTDAEYKQLRQVKGDLKVQ